MAWETKTSRFECRGCDEATQVAAKKCPTWCIECRDARTAFGSLMRVVERYPRKSCKGCGVHLSNFDYGNHAFCRECAEFERRRHNGWSDPYADVPRRLVAANDNKVAVSRECTCCKVELLLVEFGLSKNGLHGRSSICKSCRARTRGDRSGENARKRETVAAAGRAKAHRKRLLCDRSWRKYLAEKRSIARMIDLYIAKFDRPWTRPGLTEAEKYRLRYANDNEFMLRERTRRRLRRKGFGFDALWRMRQALNGKVGDVGTTTIESALGYSMADLRDHLEALFVDGMSWEAFRRGEIHIDHKTPLSRFDLNDPAHVVEAWSLTNLQPLWAADNMAKGARTDEEWRVAGSGIGVRYPTPSVSFPSNHLHP